LTRTRLWFLHLTNGQRTVGDGSRRLEESSFHNPVFRIGRIRLRCQQAGGLIGINYTPGNDINAA
jgi:hypothetical protein